MKKIIDYKIPKTGFIIHANPDHKSIVVKWHNGEVENLTKVQLRRKRYEIL